jgi:adenylate kinase family enzyme
LPDRIAVVGASGSGKSTLARALADRLDAPRLEFDAIHFLPGWEERSVADMLATAGARCPPDGRWVADGNYAEKGGDLVRRCADVIVWLDLPRRTVMLRVLRRTLGRAVRRQVLWNGNRESLRDAFSLDPDRSIFRWAWSQHAEQRRLWGDSADPRLVRLTTPAEVDAFLATAPPAGSPRG